MMQRSKCIYIFLNDKFKADNSMDCLTILVDTSFGF